MSNSKKRPLTRLIIRFPDPLYKALKAKAEATAVLMANLVRQIVAKWAEAKTTARTCWARNPDQKSIPLLGRSHLFLAHPGGPLQVATLFPIREAPLPTSEAAPSGNGFQIGHVRDRQ